MALTDESSNGTGMVMPVQPMGYENNGGYAVPYGVPMYYGNNGGFDNGFGGDGAWLILFIILAMSGGWGNGFGGFGGFGGWGGAIANDFTFPWLLNGQQGINANTNAGFNQMATASALGDLSNAVTSGFGDVQLGIAGVNNNICQTGAGITSAVNTGFAGVQQSLCNGFANTNQTVQNGFAQAEISENTRQMANMQQAFNAQTAVTGAINGVSSQLAKCCCDQELATANLSALVQRENCQDREALSNGIRDIITNQTANTQRILDVMCQDKIDAKNERISSLENQVNMQNLAASQAAQTAQLLQDNNAQTAALINRIAPYPQPSFLVGNPYGYGNYYGNGYGYNNCGCNSCCGN